ncbi:hypothetical protein TUMEXPCC7403_08845 [Tumidithrix helvetica PCC 7403]|uniref:hypothetical protein n=1 Tax=Tumidithrix helvetica TaxID=3457545 RepID=UPI003C8FA508
MSDIQIIIEYQTYSDSSSKLIKVLPEDYYDLDPDEEPSMEESVERYSYLIDYLDVPVESVKHIRLTIIDSRIGRKEISNIIYWNSGKNFMIQRYDICDSKTSLLTVISLRASDSPIIDEILRFENIEEFDIPKLAFHVQIETHNDGSQTEKEIV